MDLPSLECFGTIIRCYLLMPMSYQWSSIVFFVYLHVGYYRSGKQPFSPPPPMQKQPLLGGAPLTWIELPSFRGWPLNMDRVALFPLVPVICYIET